MNNLDDDTIIITFTDKKYIPIFNIFYRNFRKLGLNNLLVVCLDLASFIHLSKKNVRTLYRPYRIESTEKFWMFRFNVINEIFKNNKKNIIHTDSDCIWFKDILSEIKKLNGAYDVIGSIAFKMPENIVKNMGFVLCCGFYYIKYTEQNSLLLDKIKHQDTQSVDDQVLFNRYIYRNKRSIVENKDGSIIYKTIMLHDNTKIGIIHNHVISRVKCNKHLYCFHPFLEPKNILSKLLLLRGKMVF